MLTPVRRFRLNSLLPKLLGLFLLVLLSTMAAGAILALKVAQRSVESEIRERTQKLAEQTATTLRRAQSDDAIDEALGNLIKSHRGLLRAEVGRLQALGIDADFQEASSDADGVVYEHWRGPMTTQGQAPPGRVREGDHDALVITHAFLDGHDQRARLTLVASLQEAQRLAQAERTPLLGVAVGSAFFIVIMLWLVVGRLIVRRVHLLEATMRAVQHGHLDATMPAPEQGGDELAYLARGFNRMLEQIRGFNESLRAKIEDATAELTRKNRALADLNELLVVTQRELTAQERLAALGQLSGTIAHELGNPLNAVSGHVQLLARRPDLAEPARKQLELVSGEIQRMTQIIRRFLDQTRAFRPSAEPVSMQPLIDEALDLTLGTEARARIAVQREVDEGALHVRTDPGLVRHLLTNLVANAVDAMPGGGKLEVRARRDGNDLVLQVSDTGQGMTPDVKRHIFEPFYTTKPQGKGTGLGLSICKEIARGLRGRIEVDSEPGRGSTFTVRFPAEPVPAAA